MAAWHCSHTHTKVPNISGDDVVQLLERQEQWLVGVMEQARTSLDESHHAFYIARQARDLGRLWDNAQPHRNFSGTSAVILAKSESATRAAIKLNKEVAIATAE